MKTQQQKIVTEFRKMRKALEQPSAFRSDEEDAFYTLVNAMRRIVPELFTDGVCEAIYTNERLWNVSEK